jgi:hypothetical protein
VKLQILILISIVGTLLSGCASKQTRSTNITPTTLTQTAEYNGQLLSELRKNSNNEIESEWVVHKHVEDDGGDINYSYSKFIAADAHLGQKRVLMLIDRGASIDKSIVVDALILSKEIEELAIGGPDCHSSQNGVFVAAALYEPEAQGKTMSLKAWGLDPYNKKFTELAADSVTCEAGMGD